MSHRCTNAFTFNDHVYAGGCEVQDDDPILETHAAHFVKVGESTLPVETATAAHPRAVKKAAPKKAPAKPAPAKEDE
ncbi:Uncharacterised protein [Mycobacteroides abscessus]|uniref:hypothetical protein n=1 Tax=Mycobacteroides abscessus TaxID=36809 RepID=UPI0005EA3EAB|nr:hypothetical protein [Mycobacteroides abscessus]CPX29511.1 Uncharacterised protein [Mycobacteroides abscessus]